MSGLRQEGNDVESPPKLGNCKMFRYVYTMQTPLIRKHAMSSKSSGTRENQKKLYDRRIQERRADLEKKGLTLEEINKDKVHQHLKAKRRAIMKAIAAIADSRARNEPRKEAAEEPAAPAPPAPKEKKSKKEKPEKGEKAAPAAKAGD